MISRRNFLGASCTALSSIAFLPTILEATDTTLMSPPEIGRSTRTSEISKIKPARLVSKAPNKFKILQVTDFHFFNATDATDQQTMDDCQKYLELADPDLVAITGDLWHDNPSGRGNKGLERALKTFTSWGVPWTSLWGNHDKLDDYQQGHDALQSAKNSCYRGAETHGDHRIEVLPKNAEDNASPALDIFILNSSDTGLTAWQVNAFREMSLAIKTRDTAPIASLLFFHIPVLQYESKLETMRGVKLEPVSHGKEIGEACPVFSTLQNLKACFCGHNHLNDYALNAGSFDLVYGRSTGRAGYGGDKVRKGAKLIEVDLLSGKYQQHTFFTDGSKLIA